MAGFQPARSPVGVKRYRGATDQKVRAIYYNPKDFM